MVLDTTTVERFRSVEPLRPPDRPDMVFHRQDRAEAFMIGRKLRNPGSDFVLLESVLEPVIKPGIGQNLCVLRAIEE
jgi:hypothetical protein